MLGAIIFDPDGMLLDRDASLRKFVADQLSGAAEINGRAIAADDRS